ncbi:MAG TPA: penicillin-binding protein 2 [Candidatus Limnocylindrales bacterium]|nr:penicillin-binding protein 2 [Candidatus Limnocylindrales bacterium]
MSVLTGDTPLPDKRPLRFVTFALVAVLGFSGLTARLVYLQVAQGHQYTALSATNRSVTQAVPAPRGLIYDRKGKLLVTNVPSFAVKVRPADLSFDDRDRVVAQLASLLQMDSADVNIAIDSNPGSRFDLVRIAQDVPEATARLISESGQTLPGVEVSVESRRNYLTGPLLSQILGYEGAITPDQLARLKAQGYLPDDLVGRAGIEQVYETQLRGTYGSEEVERDASGRKIQVLSTVAEPQPGDSLELTIDTHEQELAQKALKWGMKAAGLKRGVMIVMNPQTGEVLAMVSLPTYDDNLFAKGISGKDFAKLASDPNKPFTNHAIAEHYPPGSTYKLVAGTGGLADGKITPTTRVATHGYITLGGTRFYDWNHRGFGACTIMCGFAHSSDTFFYQVAGMLGANRLAYWAHQYGFGKPTGIDLPGEVSGIVPDDAWKMQTLGQPMFGGETYQAGIGQGYDVATPIQLIDAYSALANGGKVMRPQIVRRIIGPDGATVRDFKPVVSNKLPVKPIVLQTMRRAARNVLLVRHTYNLVDMPIVVAGKSGTAEFGVRDSKGRLPFHSWFVAFVPKNPHKSKDDPTGMKAVSRTDAQLAVMAFAYDSQTLGNAATEIVKYYLQLHFGIKHDYRLPQLLRKDNFYQTSN